jgi:phosphopentomutase
VGRVISRPFTGAPGAFTRTDGRHDYSIPPPSGSHLDVLHEAGVPVHSVGKVGDLFCGRGIDEQHPGATNEQALERTTALARELPRGLVFTNLVETDQVYGHRHDVDGFHAALRRIDAEVALWLALLDLDGGGGDLLVLTADHGCDPTSERTDHTREHAPLLAAFAGHNGRRHEGPLADVGASVMKWLTGGEAPELPGRPFL